ncbi:30S ribosomal protein S2 [Candidatus Falkowbacteria bacterium CG11_big_fil_rev_8_21_14_0_20_39_10]|uniref:Small ribosomal subunit protein uS2 n=1 Tax=Candidatus Falkowbacteria bacterium CG11_big_fil_rev_8_21_14_0_20_39_10 TaxID=1974570 RepID=A0A2M6K8R9_9BACT|nr:MAG: 30S ribosomal protein S2 [Candidatus Falkowbacteria bacterium CG11_big_fil_rev_8_21_14_0_20_39_10]
MKIPSLEEMLKSGMHFGHRTGKWHPKMEPFIFTQRNGVYIIDLVKTQKMLTDALEFMKKLAAEGKTILFVGTKNQVKQPMRNAAIAAAMPYVVGKWLGGLLTNFGIIKRSIKNYQDLTENKRAGKLEKYTKKEQLNFDREIAKLEQRVGGLANLTKLPDALFVWDIKKEKTAVAEANKKNIPVIAICDTNVNPEKINYVIPANDDATKAVKLILKSVKEAIEEGKKEKK